MGEKPAFPRFCREVLQRPDLLSDPRGARFPFLGGGEKEWLKAEIGKTISSMPRQHWLDLCFAKDIPAAPCASYAEVIDPEDPVGKQYRANGVLFEANHRDWGTLTTVASPTTFHGTPSNVGRRPGESWHTPDVGEHNKEVLSEMGFSEAEIGELVKPGGAAESLSGHQMSNPDFLPVKTRKREYR